MKKLKTITSTIAKPWIFSLLLHIFFLGIYILSSGQQKVYVLRDFLELLPIPILAFFIILLSLDALKKIENAPLPYQQKLLIQILHCPILVLMYLFCVSFLLVVLSGMISPSDYTNYPSPSGQRSITIVSRNITCTQSVYLNRGFIMQLVNSFQIGTAKCSKSARAEIEWQPGETAISWKYYDHQGVIPLPAQ